MAWDGSHRAPGCHTAGGDGPLGGERVTRRPTMSDQVTDEATQVFVGHRELLFSVVYNLLGSVADTEDVLQETWVSWSRRQAQPSPVDNPRAYLVRIAVNEALARQASITRRRESYVGPWLPEPVLTE